ncbi:MAG: preprotein translocase subunit YajC [Pseudomonadales bacterium]|nr:preprotein translocase subunit YajC [Pseudomonadales bacterium]
MIDFLIPAAMAAEGPGAGGPFPGMDIFIIVGFAAIFYFMIWRPQSKRQKEHKDLIESLNKGDEVVTSGGILGRIVKVEEQYLVVEVAEKMEVKLQKGAVIAALPKGTIKSI